MNDNGKDAIEDAIESLRQTQLDTVKETFENYEERFKPGSYGFHEAFHSSWIALETFESYVYGSPAVIINKDLYQKADKIHKMLYDFYQELGRIHN